jgi:hypothetical protein
MWDLNETRDLIRTRYGRDQLELARQSIGSVVNRREYARFHYHEAVYLLDTDIDRLHKAKRLLPVMLGAGEEHLDEYHKCLFKIGAHVTACIQSMHAIADTLAHAIYFSLGCNQRPGTMEERDINLVSVKALLSNDQNHFAYSRALDSLASHDDFKYLTALANHCKHRSLIRPSLWLDMTDENPEPYALQFQEFVRNKIPHPSRPIRQFIEIEFDRLSIIIVDTGAQINATLRAKPPL